jgi:hypothetical protein
LLLNTINKFSDTKDVHNVLVSSKHGNQKKAKIKKILKNKQLVDFTKSLNNLSMTRLNQLAIQHITDAIKSRIIRKEIRNRLSRSTITE